MITVHLPSLCAREMVVVIHNIPRPPPFQSTTTTPDISHSGTKLSLLIVILLTTHAGSKFQERNSNSFFSSLNQRRVVVIYILNTFSPSERGSLKMYVTSAIPWKQPVPMPQYLMAIIAFSVSFEQKSCLSHLSLCGQCKKWEW